MAAVYEHMFDQERGTRRMPESAMAPLVRPAKLDDAVAITAAHVRSWQAGYADVISDEVLRGLDSELDRRTLRWQTIILGAEAEGTFVLVGELEGELAGWLTGGVCRQPGENRLGENRLGEVYACYVDPAHWSKGVGSALMKAGLELLTSAGYSRAVLWVLADNSRARAFYERHGWLADGGRKMYEVAGELYPEVRYLRQLP
jgi:ribosomal protein S18 acetylase RimI-like enzyme